MRRRGLLYFSSLVFCSLPLRQCRRQRLLPCSKRGWLDECYFCGYHPSNVVGRQPVGAALCLGLLIIVMYRQIGFLEQLKDRGSERDGLSIGEKAPVFDYTPVDQSTDTSIRFE